MPSQKVAVFANREMIGQLDISEGGDHSISLPTVKDRKLDLVFEYSNAVTPTELGINDDNRILALFFYDMSISEETTS